MKQSQVQADSIPLRVLVVGITDLVGGLETFVMNYCEQLSGPGIHFDFLCRFPTCSVEARITQIGGQIYHITRRSKNPLKFYWQIYSFFKRHAMNYDVIWDNETMINDITPLLLAKYYGIAHRIYHSHSAATFNHSLKGRIQGLLHQYNRKSVERIATDLWACSLQAARWAFPATVLDRQQCRIIPNAIPVDQYRYDPQVRATYRREMGLTKAYIIGNVGQLTAVKNQSFLLDAFAVFHRRYHDAVLMLVGEGADLKKLKQKAEALEIKEAVRFLGRRNDVKQLLQAMDLFVMPSKSEGLGIAAVEAQVSGLPCILSNGIPQEVKFCDPVVFLSPDSAQKWSDMMLHFREQNNIRTDGCICAQAAGYDIRMEASRLEELWRSWK